MWDLNQNARTVTSFGIAPAGATVGQVDEDLNSLFDDLMAFLATNAGYKADAASVVLVRWVVKTLCGR